MTAIFKVTDSENAAVASIFYYMSQYYEKTGAKVPTKRP